MFGIFGHMENAELTAALIRINSIVRTLDATALTSTQVDLLHSISSYACSHAQEADMLEAQRELAMIEEADARLMGESDSWDRLISRLV